MQASCMQERAIRRTVPSQPDLDIILEKQPGPGLWDGPRKSGDRRPGQIPTPGPRAPALQWW